VNAEQAIQPSLSQAPVSSRRIIGFRRHRDADDGEDDRPVEDSNTEHSQDDVKSQRRKRRRVNVSTFAASGTAV